VMDGSLSSCPPAEAVTWGKVDKDTYLQTTESMFGDYSQVMPFIAKALLDNRKRFEKRLAEVGEEQLFKEEPRARGYLRPRTGYRLYERRDELTAKLMDDVKNNAEWLKSSIEYQSTATK
jgi:deoxyhypusine synthase